MPDYSLDRTDAVQMLCDANCPEEFIQQFLAAMETGNTTAQLRLLCSQRKQQLQRMHEETKRLDILDNRRFQLEKQVVPPKSRRNFHAG